MDRSDGTCSSSRRNASKRDSARKTNACRDTEVNKSLECARTEWQGVAYSFYRNKLTDYEQVSLARLPCQISIPLISLRINSSGGKRSIPAYRDLPRWVINFRDNEPRRLIAGNRFRSRREKISATSICTRKLRILLCILLGI